MLLFLVAVPFRQKAVKEELPSLWLRVSNGQEKTAARLQKGSAEQRLWLGSRNDYQAVQIFRAARAAAVDEASCSACALSTTFGIALATIASIFRADNCSPEAST